VLGLLNSRRHPQLLSGRQDFAMLILALSPLFLLPAVNYFGASWLALALLTVIFAAGIFLLSPRDRSWVIYNITAHEGRQALARSLDKMGVEFSQDDQAGRDGNIFTIPSRHLQVRVCEFPLLKNVTIKLAGADEEFAARLEANLSRVLAGYQAQTSPMAVSLLLVATAMLIAPMSMMAQSMPEIVRLITDFIH
jgi:hypothetical protein